eukprot:1853512-Prymnesium_polylepis.2
MAHAISRHGTEPEQRIGDDLVGRELDGIAPKVDIGKMVGEHGHYVIKWKPVEAALLACLATATLC